MILTMCMKHYTLMLCEVQMSRHLLMLFVKHASFMNKSMCSCASSVTTVQWRQMTFCVDLYCYPFCFNLGLVLSGIKTITILYKTSYNSALCRSRMIRSLTVRVVGLYDCNPWYSFILKIYKYSKHIQNKYSCKFF